jgi:multidrug efflux pump subunit AcrB
MRQVNTDWGNLVPTAHFVLDQARLRAIGLDPQWAAQQLQLLLSGVPVTLVREDIRAVEIEARAAGAQRFDPARLADLSLATADGRSMPLDQIGRVEYRPEAPILKRRDRVPTITVRGDIDESLQPPEVSAQVEKALAPIRAALPQGYSIETGAAVEESAKANVALAAVFPMMIVLMLTVIMLQARSFAAMAMVFLTAPLGLVGAVPTMLMFQKPFGFTAILGMIGLGGILMRNTLILIGQIHDNQKAGLSTHDAIVEATVHRARPVLLTALAAVLAFIPLTTSSFWGPLAFVLIGGTAVGTLLTLLFLPALYAIWFRVAGS